MTPGEGKALLVIGAGGLVGRAVVNAGISAGSAVVPTTRLDPMPDRRVDIRDAASIWRAVVEREPQPRVVVLTAAQTSVVRCETDPAGTRLVNIDGTGAVADAVAKTGAKLVFLSSDYVFGDGGPHDEDDRPRPLNEYGRQKLEAEACVLGDPNNLVIRTCQVFGQDGKRANYVLATADRLAAGQVVRAREDMLGTPTYAPDLAEEIVALGMGPASGVWHVAGPDFMSRAELARHTARAFELDEQLIVVDDTAIDEVPRPSSAGLRSSCHTWT